MDTTHNHTGMATVLGQAGQRSRSELETACVWCVTPPSACFVLFSFYTFFTLDLKYTTLVQTMNKQTVACQLRMFIKCHTTDQTEQPTNNSITYKMNSTFSIQFIKTESYKTNTVSIYVRVREITYLLGQKRWPLLL